MTSLNTNSQNESNEEIDLKSIVKTLIRKKLFIFTTTSIATISTIVFTYIAKPIYKGTFEIVVKDQNKDVNRIGINIPFGLSQKGEGNLTQEYILRSPSVIKSVYEDSLEFYKNRKGNIELDFKTWREKYLDIKFIKDTNVLTISFKDEDKEFILKTLKNISSKYKNFSRRDRERDISNTIIYLESQQKILKEKSLLSQRKLNKFSIENGLGDIDGFVSLGKSKYAETSYNFNNNIESSILNNSNESSILNNIRSDQQTKSGQRFQRQFELLEKYEAEYIELSSILTPDSRIIINLKNKIKTLKESLKRPNSILINYKELVKVAKRDEITLRDIENALVKTNLEKAKQLDSWELISESYINKGRVFPKRKLFTLRALLISFIAASVISLTVERKSGILYDLDNLKRLIPCKYLETIYLGNIFLNDKIITSLFNEKTLEEVKNPKFGLAYIGNSFYTNKKNFEIAIYKNKNYYDLDLSKDRDIEKASKVILIISSGEITYKDLEILSKYINIYSTKILGWLYLDKESIFKTSIESD